MDEPPPYRRHQALTTISLILIFALAAWLRLGYLGESLWVDELHTSWVVENGLTEIPHRAAMGNQGPLYFLATWVAVKVGGFNEFALRSLSLACGLCLVPLSFCCVRCWTDSKAAGLVTAALVAIDPLLIFYSNEARPYATVQLLGLAQVMTLAGLIDKLRSQHCRWVGFSTFTLLSVALFYLHYTAALLLVAEGICLIFIAAILGVRGEFRNDSIRKLGLALLSTFGIIAIACMPAIRSLLDISRRRGQWDAMLVEWPNRDLLRIVLTCVAVPTAIMLFHSAIRMCGTGFRRRPLPSWRVLMLTAAWMLGPVIAVTLLSQAEWANLLLNRYVIASAVGAMVWAGLSVGMSSGGPGRVLAAGCIVSLAAGVIWHDYQGQLQTRNEGWREAVALINSSTIKGEPLLVCAGLVEDELLRQSDDPVFRAYCEFPMRGLYQIADERAVIYPLPSQTPHPLSTDHFEAVQTAGGAWLLVRGPQELGAIIAEDVLWSLREAGIPATERSRHSFGLLTCVWLGVEP